ncbi:hypothetical protein KQ944_15050 [Bacillus subtilis]|uniref:hypothetical protein n=1 Tax=Pseudochrobactrum asaccharolyticum TaxID=354351 RepID=UPI001F34AD03|nr:hypothetical protein [Pseudochrobactrum asaccharolyticum]MCF7646206.1 hypothetical protein [Pseudochrobactrum asaccharolyticum]MCF7672953.1 hypothetical protein [Bacillus subtilis]
MSLDILSLAACKWHFSVRPVLMYQNGSVLKRIVGTALLFVPAHCPTQNRSALLLEMLNSTFRSGTRKTLFSARHSQNLLTNGSDEVQMR